MGTLADDPDSGNQPKIVVKAPQSSRRAPTANGKSPPMAPATSPERFGLGWYSRPGGDKAAVVEGVLEIELLSATEMQHYFPTSELLQERLLGLTKSLAAVK